jgi:maltose alpha-D-glucosyltransferase/alpha-amylase
MQWMNAKNGGFSPAGQVVLPVISGAEFGYEKVNVASEQRDPGSFLNWIERMTRLRLRSPEFGTSRCEWLEASDPAVLAHCCHGGTLEEVRVVFGVLGRDKDHMYVWAVRGFEVS